MEEYFTLEDSHYQNRIIGEFFIKFDSAISTIPFIIPQIIYDRHYSNLEQRNIETLLVGMTASSLKTIFDSLLFDNYKSIPELLSENNKISKALAVIIEYRNSFAHGSYRIGWKDLNGNMHKDYLSLRHSKATKDGYEKRSGIYSISQIEKLINQLRTISSSYLLINTILFHIREKYEITNEMETLKTMVSQIGKVELKPIEILK